MARSSKDRGATRGTNTVQLRSRIPSGRTPTIDSAHEPAAASFDTDDEAAGRPAQQAAIEQALANEGRVEAQVPGSAQTPESARTRWPALLFILAAVSVAAVVLVLVVLN
jgi:hypothetical protein